MCHGGFKNRGLSERPLTENWGLSELAHTQGGHPHAETKFPDFSLTFPWPNSQFFTDQNTAVIWPICLLAADKWQIPFTSSLNCTSLILQMKEIKSLNSFLAQNVLKLTSFLNFEQATRAREKINTFSHFKLSKYLLQHIFRAKIMKFPDFSLTFLVLKISLTNLQNSLTFPWPWRKIKFPWLFPDQWPPWHVKKGVLELKITKKHILF